MRTAATRRSSRSRFRSSSPVAPITKSGTSPHVTLAPRRNWHVSRSSEKSTPNLLTERLKTTNTLKSRRSTATTTSSKRRSTLQLFKMQGTTDAFVWDKLPEVMKDAVRVSKVMSKAVGTPNPRSSSGKTTRSNSFPPPTAKNRQNTPLTMCRASNTPRKPKKIPTGSAGSHAP